MHILQLMMIMMLLETAPMRVLLFLLFMMVMTMMTRTSCAVVGRRTGQADKHQCISFMFVSAQTLSVI